MNLKELEAIQVLLQHSKLGWASKFLWRNYKNGKINVSYLDYE